MKELQEAKFEKCCEEKKKICIKRKVVKKKKIAEKKKFCKKKSFV